MITVSNDVDVIVDTNVIEPINEIDNNHCSVSNTNQTKSIDSNPITNSKNNNNKQNKQNKQNNKNNNKQNISKNNQQHKQNNINTNNIKQHKKYSQSTKLKTAYEIYRDASITVGPYIGIPSIAARHTAIEYGAIQLDVGHTPREVGMNKLLVLISHGHTDHSSDICNCIGHGDKVTVFVPAYCAEPLFTKIKNDMFIQKGRMYTDEEIVKIVRIIGCKRDNGEFKDQDAIYSDKIPTLKIAELIKMGDQIPIKLRGRDEVMIEPFSCYHTVDTCGYVVYEIRKRLSDVITAEPGFLFDVNFTEDQIIKKKKKNKSNNNPDTIIIEENDESDISNVENSDWTTNPKFTDVVAFSKRHNVEIDINIIDKIITDNFTLKVRQLSFPNGLSLKTKDDNDNNCILIGQDFEFLKKYKINIHTDQLIPKTMFFGDTGSWVFNPTSIGYSRVNELLGMVETVIIESTFL